MKKVLIGLAAVAVVGGFIALTLFNPSVSQTEIRKTLPNEQFFDQKAH